MKGEVSKKTKWTYCIGATGRDAAYCLVSMFVLSYVQYSMRLTAAQFAVISAAMVICAVWDAVNDLMMSAIIENSRFKMGKYRPFILVGALLNACVIIAMFTIRPKGWGFVIFFVIAYLLWGMTYTVNDIAYWGMLPSLSSDPKERDSLVTLMGVFVCIGQFAVGGIVPSVVAGNYVVAYRVIALIVGLAFALFQMLTFFGVTENEREDNPDVVTFKGMFTILKRNDQLVSAGIAYILFCAGQQLLLLLATNFFYFEFGYSTGANLVTYFTVMFGLGTLIAQFVYPVMSAKLTRMKTLTISVVAIIVGYVALFAFGYVIPKSIILVNIIGFVIFFFQGIYSLAMIVMVNNTIEYDEYRFGERHDSIISAIRSFASKLSGALDSGLVYVVLTVSGIYALSQKISEQEELRGLNAITEAECLANANEFIKTALPSQTLKLRIGMVLIPLLALIGAFVILKKNYKIDEKEYDRLVKEIAARKENNAKNTESNTK